MYWSLGLPHKLAVGKLLSGDTIVLMTPLSTMYAFHFNTYRAYYRTYIYTYIQLKCIEILKTWQNQMRLQERINFWPLTCFTLFLQLLHKPDGQGWLLTQLYLQPDKKIEGRKMLGMYWQLGGRWGNYVTYWQPEKLLILQGHAMGTYWRCIYFPQNKKKCVGLVGNGQCVAQMGKRGN